MQSPTKNMKLLYKSKFVLTYLGFLECDKIEAIANNDKKKVQYINKDELCKVINKFCEGINKYAAYYEGGVLMNFKNDLATIPDESEQKELLEKLLMSPSLRKSPIKSPPKKSPPRPPPPKSPLFHTPNKTPVKAVRNLSPELDKIEVCAVVHNSDNGSEPPPEGPQKPPTAALPVATPAPPAVTQQQGQQQPPKERGICRYFKQGKCKHTNQGGDTCEYKHPEVCKIFLLAGNSEKGCQNDACKELHPYLCGKWLRGGWTGSCGNKECKKVHPEIPKNIPNAEKGMPKISQPAPPKHQVNRPPPPNRERRPAPWNAPTWREGMEPYVQSPHNQQAYFEKRFQAMQNTMMEQMKQMMQSYMVPHQRANMNHFNQPPPPFHQPAQPQRLQPQPPQHQNLQPQPPQHQQFQPQSPIHQQFQPQLPTHQNLQPQPTQHHQLQPSQNLQPQNFPPGQSNHPPNHLSSNQLPQQQFPHL